MDISASAALSALSTAPSRAASLKAETAAAQDDPALREAAKKFEQVFLGEMLKRSGLAETAGAFGGGYGEEAFKSFLIDEYAKQLSDHESFGLAEHIYAQLKEEARGR